jgi:hypothetical protein
MLKAFYASQERRWRDERHVAKGIEREQIAVAPDTITSALPLTASSRNLSSFGSRQPAGEPRPVLSPCAASAAGVLILIVTALTRASLDALRSYMLDGKRKRDWGSTGCIASRSAMALRKPRRT